ncbi:MAG TPA: hypothetical protein PLM06_07995 [Anaerolineae bacterium]|nr:hypothetical protein [Anaerolineae bacterium]
MKTKDDHDNYAYILRLWRESLASPEQPAVWRFSLTDVRSGERHAFDDPAKLAAFLQTRMLTAPAHDENSNRESGGLADNE